MPKQHSLLLIEDDHLLGPLYRQLLLEVGYRVAWAQSGMQALEELHHKNFDMVLMDVMLPEMSGIELLDNMKPYTNSVVALTNLDQAKVREELIEKGAKGVVIKSDHTPDTFLSTVAEFVTHLEGA